MEIWEFRNSPQSFGFAISWKSVFVRLPLFASASPVAVQPLVGVGSSGVDSGDSPRRRSGLRPYFSASAFVQIRSDRCLAQRLGGKDKVQNAWLCITRKLC